jgi:hypothetical protein
VKGNKQDGVSHPWRSVAWLIGLALAVCMAVLVLRLSTALRSGEPRAGDGRHVETYGFNLSNCRIPADEIVAAGLPKDGLQALVRPRLMTGAQLDSLNAAERGKYLVPDDRVIGLVLGGQARAYPLRVLNWHEIANDTLGGEPIAVTYNPLCGSSAGFSRRFEAEVLEFGCSGLLYNSNLLMYDRRPQGVGESLWSQILMRAVAGPAAAADLQLTLLPIAVVPWRIWRTWHPESTVLFPEVEERLRYKRDPYSSYEGSDRLRFPVSPLSTEAGRPYKDRIVALPHDSGWTVFALADLAEAAARGEGQVARIDLGRSPAEVFVLPQPPAIAAVSGATGEPLPLLTCYWFAWHGMYPKQAIVSP